MSISVIIPLGTGSRWNDMELRFCLRSIEACLSNYGDIFIVGELPYWLQNVIHIPIEESGYNYHKEMNIFNKIMAAALDERVTDEFYFTNDDHFLLKEFDAATFPYHYSGMLNEQENRIDLYGRTVRQTIEMLGTKNGLFQIPNFDTHCPIRYTKEGMERIRHIGWSTPWSYCIKTTYAMANNIEGTYYPDLKINRQYSENELFDMIRGRQYFSMGDHARGPEMHKLLTKLYPHSSKYEKK